jgi:hypothetical protein
MSCPNYFSQPEPLPIRTDPEENSCLGINEDGSLMSLREWKNYWANLFGNHTNCTEVFNRKIYSGRARNFNPLGFQEVEEDFSYMFSRYFNATEEGHIIGVPGQEGYDDFQQTLISACSNNPRYELGGACQTAAKKMCTGCTATEVTSNTDLLKLCGCSVNSLEGTKQYDKVPRACDPMCVSEQVSKNRDPVTGVVEECNSTVCVINNISINASESVIGGAQFTQICPQCSGGNQCTCIYDATIPNMGEKVGINNNFQFTQYCGPNAVCIKVNPDTNETETVPCEDAIPPLEPQTFNFPIPIWVWISVIVILVFVLLVLFSARYIGKNQKIKIHD